MIERLQKYALRGILVILFVSIPHHVSAQSLSLRGQLSAWIIANLERLDESQAGLRYIPALSATLPVSQAWTLDGEFSSNGYGLGRFDGWQDFQAEGRIKPYRVWLRVSSAQMEARLGLQKINFGSASLLRPLMWFDRIDPRDPLQITDGVWGLLLRYYFLNNVNIWLWGLTGNDEIKGWEFAPTASDDVEYGGRVQVPVPRGEIGLTFHRRRADLDKGLTQLAALLGASDDLPVEGLELGVVRENRLGFDGRWDIEIGFWCEVTFIHQDIDLVPYRYQRSINIGADYTIGLGNGLHLMAEHLFFDITEEAFGKGEGFDFTAGSMNYPLGLIDNLTAMIFYDWENHDWYRFVNWQRTYDAWSLYVIAFWNPDRFQLYQTVAESSLFAGKGFQLMMVFNH